jgi:hypothetical protein
MTKTEVSELIEFVYAWGADRGVMFSESFIDPETGEILPVTREKVAA